MRRGLVFGKFMPLHRGHQLLIERALAECDDVTVVVYDSRPPGDYQSMPVALRTRWVAGLYPELEQVVAVPDPHPEGGDDRSYAQEYAEGLRFLGEFDRCYTSEPSYQDFVRELNERPRGKTARHMVVDEARDLVPISGTRIREDLYAHRAWLDPLVYTSLVEKVAIVGSESTGKSTLALALAAEYRTLWTHEYGRELWESQNLTGTFAQHLGMARRQLAREEAARRHARRYVFCDTTAWTTLHWSRWAYGVVDVRLEDLVEETMGDYRWILCDNDFAWVQDGTREMGGNKAELFQLQQLEDLTRRGVDFQIVQGPLEMRVDHVKELLGSVRATA